MTTCSLCETELEPNRNSRGLCETCYGRESRAGRRHDWPRRTWPRDELMEEWDRLRHDCDRVQAAERIGISPVALDRAIWRARKAGDPRAVPGDPGGIYAQRKAARRGADRQLEHTR